METIAPGSSRPVANAATDREAYPETSPQTLHHSSDSIAPAATDREAYSETSPQTLHYSSDSIAPAATDREAYPETSPQTLHHSSDSVAPSATDRTATEEEHSASLRHLSTAELCSLASSTATRYVQAVIDTPTSLPRNISDESRTSEITTILLLARELQRRCTEPQTLQTLCVLTQAQLDLARTSIPQAMIPHYLVRVRRCVRVVGED